MVAFVAAFPGLIAPDDPQARHYAQNAGPSSAHLLGTTQLGQDVFSQLIWSTRQTLLVTLIVSAIATFLSTIIGVTAAYIGGVVDRVLMVLIDVFLILPVLPLLILLAAYLPPGVTSLTIVLCITSWAFQARQLRSQGLSLRNRDFLVSARVRGERALYIILVEIVPDDDLAAGRLVSVAGRVRGRVRRQPAVPGARQQRPADVGHDALQRPAGVRRSSRATSGGRSRRARRWRCWGPASRC